MSAVTLVLLMAVFAEVSLVTPAWGHDPPQGTALSWIPSSAAAGGTGERLLIRTNRGLIVQNDHGFAFDFLCNEAIGVASTEEAPMAVAPGGSVFVATFAGGLRTGASDLCRWQGAADAAGTLPAFDVTTDPATPSVLYLLAGKSDTTTNFFVSPDVGLSWSALAPSDIPYTRVRVAASNPRRVYRTGVGLSADSEPIARLSVSDDGGATANELRIPLATGELQAQLLGVDPTNPERIFVHVEATSNELPERLIVSDDGGTTFATALTSLGLNGFAMSPDGNTVWVGGTMGLWRSSDRGEHFDPVANGAVTRIGCLAFHANQLFACGVTNNEFDVSVSADQGDSFRKLVSFSQVNEIISCPIDSPVATECDGPMAHWRYEVATFNAGAGAASAGATAGGSGSPGGAFPAPEATPGGAAQGCGVAPTPPSDVPGTVLLIALIAGVTQIWPSRHAAGVRVRGRSSPRPAFAREQQPVAGRTSPAFVALGISRRITPNSRACRLQKPRVPQPSLRHRPPRKEP